MRLVLQKTDGDCGIATLATLADLSYEDVYVQSAAVDRERRGRYGLTTRAIFKLAHAIGVTLRQRKEPLNEAEDEGIVVVRWLPGSKHAGVFKFHLLAYAYGVAVDSADGAIMPLQDYLVKEQAELYQFWEVVE